MQTNQNSLIGQLGGAVRPTPLKYLIFSILIILILTTSVFAAKDKGEVIGQVVDAETGDALIGANVVLEGTLWGSACDLDGNYKIQNVPPGSYTMLVMMMGYNKVTITDVVVKAGEITKISTAASPEVIEGQEVTVTAKAIRSTEAVLLKDRQKAVAVSDAISAEAISQSGAGDAAAAMKKVTGASVVGGKYVYIRGLGERYSNTFLNGAELPSADPDKKSFQLDLFPSSLLENIVTLKTFTPDKPGTFSGGLVDVTTKDFPDKFMFNFSVSTSYNTKTTFNDNFFLPNSGDTDWLGIDDGTRSIPDLLSDPNLEIPTYSSVKTREDAYFLDALSKAFNNQMAPGSADALLNQGFSLSTGSQFKMFNQDFGFMGSLSWGQDYSFYDDGEIGRWKAPGKIADLEALDPQQLFTDQKASHDVNWGSMLSLAYKNPKVGRISASYIKTQSGSSTARYVSGYWKDVQSGTATTVYETRVLSWVERNLNTFQFEGKHHLPWLAGASLIWKSSYSVNDQEEPDQRYFSDHYTIHKTRGTITYQSPNSLYSNPIRYFRNLEESNFTNNIDLSVPFKQWNGFKSTFKMGFNYTDINRDYIQRRFEYIDDEVSYKDYGPDVNEFFSQVGLIDTTSSNPNLWSFANVITEAKSLKNKFTGDQTTYAGYLMFDVPLTATLRFVGGVRVEQTEMIGKSADPNQPVGELDNTDYLPSVNLIYNLKENMNLRFAYTNTLARPTFRELAPYSNFEFAGDYLFEGNAKLKRTLIKNLDLRWEWFLQPGEIVAVSGFYKDFTNPIERFIDDSQPNDYYSVTNVDQAIVYGLELELRKELSNVWKYLSGVSLGTNLSLVNSEVDIPAEDYRLIALSDSTADKKRPFQGQSPYLFNCDVSYTHMNWGFNAGLFYNVFGDRLDIVTRGASPDVYERSFGSLDFKASQKLFGNYKLSFAAKNLLNPDIKFSQEFKGDEFIYLKYKRGTTYSLSLSVNW